MMRSCVAVAVVVMLLPGCSSVEGISSSDGDCRSHYQPVATAPTLAALKKTLLREVDPGVRSLRVIDEDPSDDKVVVNLLTRRNRLVMSLDAWQQNDSTWTAKRWAQCID